MARSRLGGSRSKLRGACGSVIYQMRKGADGKTEQIVQARPEEREYSNTEAQIKARMIMGQIQRMFHILPRLIQTAFATIPMGTLSLQHFSKLNRPLLAEDFDSHYTTYGDFDWRAKRDMTAPAGRWILTEGQMPEIIPDRVSIVANVPTDVEAAWSYLDASATYGDLLTQMGMVPGDRIYFLMFRKDIATMTPAIDVHYFEASTAYPLETLLEDVAEDELFAYSGNADGHNSANPDTHYFDFQVTYQDFEPESVIACFAFILFHRNANGSIKFSSSRFRWYGDRPWRWFDMQAPYDVYDSWAEP